MPKKALGFGKKLSSQGQSVSARLVNVSGLRSPNEVVADDHPPHNPKLGTIAIEGEDAGECRVEAGKGGRGTPHVGRGALDASMVRGDHDSQGWGGRKAAMGFGVG